MNPIESIPVIYQDKSLIVIDKPAGLLVHKSEIDKHETRFLIQELRDQIGKKVYPVHRLDKPTSGIMVFAFDIDIQRKLSFQFENNQVEKHYLALVRGSVNDELTIDYPLKEKAVFKSQDKSQLPTRNAITHIKKLRSFEIPVSIDKYPTSRYSLVEVNPKTGRRHQIRRHMKHISHPIIGDTSYGKTTHNNFFRDDIQVSRLMLHASTLVFEHPTTQIKISFATKENKTFNRVIFRLSELEETKSNN